MAKTKFKADKHHFVLAGNVLGVDSKNFYKTRETNSGKEERALNFRIEFNKGDEVEKEGSSQYVQLTGYSGNAYIYDQENKVTLTMGSKEYKELLVKDKERVQTERAKVKNEKDKYAIKNRYSLLSGVAVKLGDMKDVVEMTAYEGAEFISDFLKANPTAKVRVVGEVDYSVYRKDGELNVSKKLIIKRIYTSDEDITKPNYEATHGFSSEFIFTNVITDGEPTIEGYTVGKNDTIVPISIQSTQKLANDIKRAKVKPFTHMKFTGKIMADVEDEAVEEKATTKSYFGEETSEYTKNPYASGFNRYFLVVGADPESADEEKYTKKEIEDMFKNQVLYGDEPVETTKKSTLGDIEKSVESADDEDEFSDEYPF